MAVRPKRGRSETRANDFPANVSVRLNDGSEIDFQNDYTGHGAVREAISSRATVLVLVVVVRRSSLSLSSLQKGSFASPIFIRSAHVILLFSRTIKFPVMARFRLSEEASSPRGQAENGLLECRKGRARA